MKSNILIFSIIMMSFLSCETREKDINIDIQFEKKLTGKMITALDTGCYDDMDIINSTLYLRNFCGKTFFHLLDLSAENYRIDFGNRGQGPEEFNEPLLLRSTNDSVFMTFDINTCEIKSFKTNIKDCTLQLLNIKNIDKSLRGSYEMFLLQNKDLIGIKTDMGKGLFFKYNSSSDEDLVWAINKRYKKLFNNLTMNQAVFSDAIWVHELKQKVAVAMKYYNHLHFYTMDGALIKTLSIGKKITPVIDKKHQIVKDESKYCFIDIYGTKDYIYALWLGKSFQQLEQHAEKIQSGLFVFNWDGDLIKTFELDRTINRLAIDEQEQKLYGSERGEEGMGGIWVYDLK